MMFRSLAIATLLLHPLLSQGASSGTLSLSGSVPLVNSIVVTAAGSYNALNITGGVSNTSVASVAETSNDVLGYGITMASANGGELRNTSDATKKTTYTISYNSAAAVAPTVAALMVKTISSLSGLVTNTSPVNINVTAYASAPAGTYADTLTFAIVAH